MAVVRAGLCDHLNSLIAYCRQNDVAFWSTVCLHLKCFVCNREFHLDEDEARTVGISSRPSGAR